MKAVVLHEYGGPEKLKWEDFADPKPAADEVLIRVSAISLNPVDWKMRSGAAADHFPVEFPGILGRDVAGIIREVGSGVTGWQTGDRVMALAKQTYAELCAVKASTLTRIPHAGLTESGEGDPATGGDPAGMDMTTAATLPLAAATGDQLVHRACAIQAGHAILLTGALGSVGRCAVYAAKEAGARVIAGVRASQLDEARALPGVTAVVALDDEAALTSLGLMDAIGDTVGGPTATKLLAHVKPGGRFGSLLGPPAGAELHPTVTIAAMMAVPDPERLAWFADAVRQGKLEVPVDRVLPMPEAAAAHKLAESGKAKGKVVLTA